MIARAIFRKNRAAGRAAFLGSALIAASGLFHGLSRLSAAAVNIEAAFQILRCSGLALMAAALWTGIETRPPERRLPRITVCIGAFLLLSPGLMANRGIALPVLAGLAAAAINLRLAALSRRRRLPLASRLFVLNLFVTVSTIMLERIPDRTTLLAGILTLSNTVSHGGFALAARELAGRLRREGK
ncbi:MAG: hypothetical protein ACKVX9_20815 [Blastocatellia bacterium]